ncbi:multidrug efflux MFS transporter MdtH [Vogesella indigofera]|uniref:multidrug efflux MFS transporter MdtH n=1 Tax=Vogesella indigofera TaxID=45465 RepID=UPI00234F87B7|nr:multidrug efflux MFS transporter MdtH [Vogesella indigofera]MDC7700807.1 multidrug efflux MFS transporter MdtH [Vogesella indigofera]
MSSPEQARRYGRWFIMTDNLLVVMGFFIVFPLISLHFVDRLGWAATLVGVALAIRQLLQQGLGLLGGTLADRYGAKPLIVSGMLLRAAGFAMMANASSPWWLIASCVFSGLGGTLFDPPRSALIVKLTRPHERNRFYTLLMMQDSAGAVIGALLGSWLLHYDFWWVGMSGCAIFLLAALVNAQLLPPYRVASKRAPPSAAARTVLHDRAYMRFVLILSGYYALGVQIMLLVPVTLKQLAGTAAAVGWMYTLETLLSLSLLYPLARLGERYLSQEARILAGILLMSSSLLLMSQIQSWQPAFVVLGLFYLGTIITEPPREARIAGFAKAEARASYMGMSRMGLALGGASGYVGGGWLLDIARQLQQPGLPWLVLSLVGYLTCLLLHRQFRADRGAERQRRWWLAAQPTH